MDCIFCKIIEGKISSYKVWENRNFLVFLDIAPINPGHLLVVPKRHVEDIYDLSDSLYSDLFILAKKISYRLKKSTKAKKIGLIVEGFGVSHAHVHLVPINQGNELNPERAKKASDDDLKKMQEMLSIALFGI